jgi:hypothetical protein
VDSNGAVVEVSGLTDSDGYLIKKLDVINESATYNSFINGRAQIATDSLGSTGNVVIKVGESLYRYNKSALPLVDDDGSSAAAKHHGVVPDTSAVALSYNAYSNAGICYVEYDDVREGVYLKTLDLTTVSGTDYESFLDVSSSDYPWAWDQNNYTVLYYVNGTSLKYYDMDENDVAFCNVTSSEKIMSAGTSESSNIDATVLNVYGEPMSSKTVAFSVSAGDGAITTTPVCTNASGVASTTYTVGTAVGTSTVTALASDATC